MLLVRRSLSGLFVLFRVECGEGGNEEVKEYVEKCVLHCPRWIGRPDEQLFAPRVHVEVVVVWHLPHEQEKGIHTQHEGREGNHVQNNFFHFVLRQSTCRMNDGREHHIILIGTPLLSIYLRKGVSITETKYKCSINELESITFLWTFVKR